jgi:CHAT domain-containing protein
MVRKSHSALQQIRQNVDAFEISKCDLCRKNMLITLCRKLALPAVQLLLGLLLTLGMAWAQPIPLSVAVVKNKMLAAVKAGDAANAIELGEQWLVNANKVLVPNREEQAEIMSQLGEAYFAAGQYEQAELAVRQAISTSEKIKRLQNVEFVRNLVRRASSHLIAGETEKAFPYALTGLVITEKVTPLNLDAMGDALDVMGRIYSALGQPALALRYFQNEIDISEIHFGVEHTSTALALNNLAVTYGELAEHEKALPLQLRALSIREKVMGPDHPDTATSLDNLAATYREMAQYEKMLPLHQRALAIRDRVLGPEHPDTATSLDNLAAAYIVMAQYEKALPLQLRALAIRENVLGPEHPDTAISLSNLAATYGDLAQHEKALPLQVRALAIREKALGSEHPDTALSLNNLAATYGALAQHEKALPLEVRALAIREKALGSEHPDTALSLNNLAETYRVLAQYEKALPLQLRALLIREKVFGSNHPTTAQSLSNLAMTFSAQGQIENALPLQLRALAIREKVLGPEHPETAQSLNNLAGTYGALAQHEEALPLQLRALAIWERVLGPEHPDTAQSLSNLSWIYQHAGSPTLAIGLLKQAINIYQRQRERIATIGTNELNSYTDSINGNYQALARQLTDQGRLAEAQQVLDMLKEDEVFEFVRRSSTADPRRTRVAYTPTEAQWLGRYREIADRLGALGAEEQALQKQAKQGLTPAQEARLKALQTDSAVAKRAFLAFLGDLQKDLSAQGPARAAEVAEVSERAQRELQTLVRGMGPDVALLQYYITTDRVGMILTTPGSVQAFNTPVDAKELNRQIAAYRAVLRTPAADTLPGAQALYRLLVAPVAPTLERAGVKTIMLSLDGNLRHLPFGALHDGKQYLAQRWQLPLYTAVVKDKLRDAVSPHWNTAGLGVTKALGDFKALPAVKGELAGVLRANTGNAGTKGELFLDEDFTATRLKDVGQRNFQLMHVSSHFQLSPGTEINSFLLLGDGTRLTLGDMRNQNYRFDQVDLLTLAACDTGLGGGRDANGKEIEGLGVLAQQQGARAVLATLWPVADQSTATLMADMYQRRQAQGLSKAEALRQAQLALMAQPKYAHPFYWAPFILMGNWK